MGTAGSLRRSDFDPWLEWTFPRKVRHPECFFQGEQGLLNYVLNQKAICEGLRVECRTFMCWPGDGMQGLDAGAIAARTALPVIVHWAGMKKVRQRDMVGSDVLAYFEDLYFARLPLGNIRRMAAAGLNVLMHWRHEIRARVRKAGGLHFSRA